MPKEKSKERLDFSTDNVKRIQERPNFITGHAQESTPTRCCKVSTSVLFALQVPLL
jgi:hypothetical protein